MTYEEISRDYPVGKVIAEIKTPVHENRAWYNEQDLKIYRQEYEKVEVNPNNTCICYKNYITTIVVDGWLFDGKEWYPARNTWNGWVPMEFERDSLFTLTMDDISKENEKENV